MLLKKGQPLEMADFIQTTPGCLAAEKYRLYARILAGLLLGNTDMHFKNFAMFHTPPGVSKPTLNRFEQGKTNITLDSIMKILGMLGLLT